MKFDNLVQSLLENTDSSNQVGGNHWGPIQGSDGKTYNLYVKDVCNAADKTVKAINEPVEKFVPPTNLRQPENVEKYKQSILKGEWKWTPVYCQLYQNKYYAYDGNHRIAAALEANKIKPGIVKIIPVRDVANIIDQTIVNFKNNKKTIIGGVEVKIK